MKELPALTNNNIKEILNVPTSTKIKTKQSLIQNDFFWSISLCKAFPTYFIQILFIKDDKERKIDKEENDNYKILEENIIPTYLSVIAFYSLFPRDKETKTSIPIPIISNTKTIIPSLQEEKHQSLKLLSHNSTINSSLTYGEILPESIIEILCWIKSNNDNNNIPCLKNANIGGKVIDLGSGNGKVLFAICTNHIFLEAYGIEISYYWHMEALHYLSIWKSNNVFYEPQQNHTSKLSTASTTKFHFLNDDILSQNTNNILQDVDVIIIHGTLFDDNLFHDIETNIHAYCKIGTIIISITKPLRLFDTLSVQCKRMNWGTTNVFIQQKI